MFQLLLKPLLSFFFLLIVIFFCSSKTIFFYIRRLLICSGFLYCLYFLPINVLKISLGLLHSSRIFLVLLRRWIRSKSKNDLKKNIFKFCRYNIKFSVSCLSLQITKELPYGLKVVSDFCAL